MILRHSLWLHIGAPLIVILNKDEVLACCTKHNKRVELARMGTTTEISDKLKGGKLFLCVCVRVWVCLVALNVFASFLSITVLFPLLKTLPWPEGQFDPPQGLLIDQGTLAWRVLLCPQWGLQASLSPSLKTRNHSAVMNEEEAGGVYRNRGDKALCHSSTQLDRGRGMGVSWAGLEGGGVL